jgi:hypothetical protein
MTLIATFPKMGTYEINLKNVACFLAPISDRFLTMFHQHSTTL